MLSFAKSVALFAFFAYASATNVITSVTASTNLTPGQPFTITWTPDSSSTISLILRKGDASNLGTVGTIVANIPNTGSYTWYPENTLPGGTDYALEIVGTDGTPNYSHYFGINNDSVKAATTGAAASSGTSQSVKVTTLPESLVTDSLISDSATTTNTGVLIVSGNSTFTSFSSAALASGSSSGSQSASASATSSRPTSRSASQSIASATATASSASSIVAEIVGGTGLMTIIALTLSSMAFCMM